MYNTADRLLTDSSSNNFVSYSCCQACLPDWPRIKLEYIILKKSYPTTLIQCQSPYLCLFIFCWTPPNGWKDGIHKTIFLIFRLQLESRLFKKNLHCKCFVCRNRKCLSAILMQKQTLVNSTNYCVWLITDIFMLLLSKFSDWIYWNVITYSVYILQIFVSDIGKYFS